MRYHKKIRLAILIYIMISLILLSDVKGKIRILVKTSKGDPIPGVKVTLVSTQINSIQYEIVTNDQGVASYVAIENHQFECTFEKEGYQILKKIIEISAGQLKKEEIILATIEEAISEAEASNPHAQAVRRFNQATSFIKKKEYEKALVLLQESVFLDTSLYQAHYEIGKIFYIQEKYKEAIEPLVKVISLNAEYVPVYRLLAAVYEKLGKREESKKYTKRAQELGDTTGLDKYNEAIDYFNNKDVDSAIPLFEDAIKLDQNLALAYYHLGMAYVNKGETEKAIQNLEKYLELEPEGINADTARSFLKLLKQNNYRNYFSVSDQAIF